MAGFASLNTVVSGLYAAQAGLYVTGHNVSNATIPGYSRQQTIQQNFMPQNIGYSARGTLQVGLGTDIAAIRQVRNTFLDTRYRDAIKQSSFHEVKVVAGYEIQSILGELEGDYVTQKIIQDMRDALNELTLYLPGLETRGNFINTAVSFVTKMNNIYDRLTNYQQNLNEQVVQAVHDVNTLAEEINHYNKLIAISMASGDRPNDYLDARNLALDKLSSLVSTDVYQNKDGTVDVLIEGKELVTCGTVSKLGLRYTSQGCDFVEPVFTQSDKILPWDSKAQSLFNIIGPVDALHENDYGLLKGLIVTRGSMVVNYTTAGTLTEPDPSNLTLYPGGASDPNYRSDYNRYLNDVFNTTQAFIPRVLAELDGLFNKIVKMINDACAPTQPATVTIDIGGVATAVPNAPYYLSDPSDPTSALIKNPGYTGPYALDKETQGIEVFSRKYVDRFGVVETSPGSGVYEYRYIGEDPSEPTTLYTLSNVVINPEFSTADGYTKLCFSYLGDIEDANAVHDILATWTRNFGGVSGSSVETAYRSIIVGIATEAGESETIYSSQIDIVNTVDQMRQTVSGVSIDEEMTNMMKFQHAYNSASRMLSVLDSMLDTVVNRMGAGRG